MFKELEDGVLFLDTDGIDLERLEKENEKRCEELLKKGVTLEDFSIVRSTNGFPLKGFVSGGGKFVAPATCNSCFSRLVSEENLKRSEILLLRFRDTVHWSVNGLVGSHIYGNFENRKCIIIDSFMEHANDSNLKNVQPNDLYFKGNVKLTDKATILIPLRFYQAEKDTEEFQELKNRYKIVVFNKDEEIATKAVLFSLGYTFHEYGMWDFVASDLLPNQKLVQKEMRKNLHNIASENGIEYENHTHTKEANEEIYKKIETYDHSMEVMRKVIEEYLCKNEFLFDKIKEKSLIFDSFYSEEDLMEPLDSIDNIEDYLSEYSIGWLEKIAKHSNKWKSLSDQEKIKFDIVLDEEERWERYKDFIISCGEDGESLVDIINSSINDWNKNVKESIDPSNIGNYFDNSEEKDEDSHIFLFNINGKYVCIKSKKLFEILGEEVILSLIEETNNRINQEYLEAKEEYLSSMDELSKEGVSI